MLKFENLLFRVALMKRPRINVAFLSIFRKNLTLAKKKKRFLTEQYFAVLKYTELVLLIRI